MGRRSKASRRAKERYSSSDTDICGRFRPKELDGRLGRVRRDKSKPSEPFKALLTTVPRSHERLIKKLVEQGLIFPKKDFPSLLRDGFIALPAMPLHEGGAHSYWRTRIDDVCSGKIKAKKDTVLEGRIVYELFDDLSTIPDDMLKCLISEHDLAIVKAHLMAVDVEIISLTCIVVPPWADPQDVHRDSGSGPRAICVLAIDIEGAHMRTQFAPGTHSSQHIDATPEEKASLRSVDSSRILFDPHTLHCGGPNPSSALNMNRIFITFRAKTGEKLMTETYEWSAKLQGKSKKKLKSVLGLY